MIAQRDLAALLAGCCAADPAAPLALADRLAEEGLECRVVPAGPGRLAVEVRVEATAAASPAYWARVA